MNMNVSVNLSTSPIESMLSMKMSEYMSKNVSMSLTVNPSEGMSIAMNLGLA